MSAADLFSITIGSIGGIVGIAAAIGAFRGGRTGIQAQVIDAYEKRLSQMEIDMKGLKDQLVEVNKKLDEAEKDRVTLTAVLQGRNPEFDTFMSTSLRLLNDIHSKVMPLSTSLNVVSPA